MTEPFDDTDETLNKLENLFAAIKDGKAFAFEIDGERVEVPAHVEMEIEYERDEIEHELEITLYWDAEPEDDADEADDD